jgi:hypothetical protein
MAAASFAPQFGDVRGDAPGLNQRQPAKFYSLTPTTERTSLLFISTEERNSSCSENS